MRVDSVPRSSGRTWTIATTSGYTATGYLPDWAEADPSQTDVPPDRLHIALADVTHQAVFGGQLMRVACGTTGQAADTAVLLGGIECRPFPEDSEPRAPVVAVQIVDDYWIRDLDPSGVLTVAGQFRAFADLLATQVAPALEEAVSEWAEYGSSVRAVDNSQS